MNKVRSGLQRALIVFASVGLLAATFLTGILPGSAQQNGLKHYLPIIHGQGGPTLPPPDEAASKISLPPGFSIRIFAQNLPSNPRLMQTGPDGWLYVALMSSGSIARLPDRNRDGIADGVEIAASGLNLPHNLEWNGEWMYVAENDRIERLRDNDQDGSYETRELVTDNIPGAGGHSSRTLHFGPDGKLYVTTGSTCNICEESDPRRAAMLRFNPDGSIPTDNPFAGDSDPRKRAVWAWGLRNSVDFLWAADGTLWANQNGSDGLGDEVPPEEIFIPVQKGKSHGWPYCYTPVNGLNQPQQAEVRDTRIALPSGFTCAQAVPALFTDSAHAAPLGMSAASPAFPAEYRDDIFVAYHGSWNTDNPNNYRDCKVQRIVIENGAPVRSETFATGWRAPGAKCGDASTWGRPADVAVGGDQALYISDDKGMRIYRVVYTGN